MRILSRYNWLMLLVTSIILNEYELIMNCNDFQSIRIGNKENG